MNIHLSPDLSKADVKNVFELHVYVTDCCLVIRQAVHSSFVLYSPHPSKLICMFCSRVNALVLLDDDALNVPQSRRLFAALILYNISIIVDRSYHYVFTNRRCAFTIPATICNVDADKYIVPFL